MMEFTDGNVVTVNTDDLLAYHPNLDKPAFVVL